MLNFKIIKIKSPLPQVVSYSIILLALIFAGSLSFVLAQVSAPHKSELSVSKAIKVAKKANAAPTPTQGMGSLANNQISQTAKQSPQPTLAANKTTPTGSNSTSTVSSSPTPTVAPAANIAENKVTLSINGGSAFDVKISESATQCDVLSQALRDGKITSLNMRYENNLGSNAVYQINGIGKDNSVWWTFKVNGQSPSQGCSYIKANNGDTVEWKYIGS